jgi:hypothetical protein
LGLWQLELPKPCSAVPRHIHGGQIPIFGVSNGKTISPISSCSSLSFSQPEAASILPTSSYAKISRSPYSVKFTPTSTSQKDKLDCDPLLVHTQSSLFSALVEQNTSALTDNLFDHEDPWNSISMILGLSPTLNNVPEIADTTATPSHALETSIMNGQKLLNYNTELAVTGPSYTQCVAEASPELSRIRFDKKLEEESHVYAHNGP